MTPLQIAKANCANYTETGACLGAIIEDDLRILKCNPKPKCTVGISGVRCVYFEDCVLPFSKWIENPNQRQAWLEAARDYRLSANVPSVEKRRCPICKRIMESRRRFCHICAKVKRTQQRRLASRQYRVSRHHLTNLDC